MKALQWLSDYMDLEEDEEVADDGFIEALNTTAREDWEDGRLVRYSILVHFPKNKEWCLIGGAIVRQ